MNSEKIWWHDEPMIVGSLRYRIIENDLLNNMRRVLAEYKATFPDSVSL